tara:strand:+ start:461 stop:2674 length:2214 start_codon:yes stop_codon:yes gene_type:complete
MTNDYLNKLNDSQKEAVLHSDGPLLILAGAGTGKTRVLTSKLAHIINTKQSFPSNILAVTFTNKAAKEMQSRIGNIIGGAVEGMNWLGTFHSIGAKILRYHSELAELRSDFTILDTDDQLKLIKEVIRMEDIDEKKFPPRFFLSFIEGWKNKGLMPNEISAYPIEIFGKGKSTSIYENYQARLQRLNCVDFGDLLLLPLHILKTNDEILNKYQKLFKYILVDEYQDTNTVQYLLLRILSQKNNNIACVGDDDQSIYGWRGADLNNILNFEKDFENARVIRLETNYRSSKNILGAARSLISHNKDRLGKELKSCDDDLGDKVKIRTLWSAEDEANFISEEIENIQHSGKSLNNIAILVRASFQMREFEDKFILKNIPYRVIGGPRFYERQEIRDVIAYLQIALNPDNDIKFERIVNTPKRGIGATTIRLLNDTSKKINTSLYEASKKILETDELKPQTKNQLKNFIKLIEGWNNKIDKIDHVASAALILEESGYINMWENDKSPTSETRIENIKELIGQMSEFSSMTDFLEHVSLVLEIENNDNIDKVSIMTLHSAKGLEFEMVFLPGMEDGVFPNQKSLDEKGNIGLEEERRLAHVGLTRAKNNLVLTNACRRRIFGSWSPSIPSRFLSEISDEFIDQEILYSNQIIENKLYEQLEDTTHKISALDRLQAAGYIVENDYEELQTEVNRITDIGQRVFHIKFGYGIILSIDIDRVEVNFEKAGKKIVLASFLEIVNNE